MITARKSEWFTRVFEVYNRNLIKRKFQSLRVAGLPHLRPMEANVPVLVCANHSSWWDGLVAFQMGRALGLDDYALMEEKHLREHKFLRKLGAFGMVRENKRDAVEAIKHAADFVRDTSRVLWIFPQGETLPNDRRPLNIYTGAARIIEKVGVIDTVVVALRYEFLEDFRPEIFARCEPPARVTVDDTFDAKRFTNDLRERMTAPLNRLRSNVLNGETSDYQDILKLR